LLQCDGVDGEPNTGCANPDDGFGAAPMTLVWPNTVPSQESLVQAPLVTCFVGLLLLSLLFDLFSSFHGFPGISFTYSTLCHFSSCSSCSQSTCERHQLLFARSLHRCQRTTQDGTPNLITSVEKPSHDNLLIHPLFLLSPHRSPHRPFMALRHSTLWSPRRLSMSAVTVLAKLQSRDVLPCETARTKHPNLRRCQGDACIEVAARGTHVRSRHMTLWMSCCRLCTRSQTSPRAMCSARCSSSHTCGSSTLSVPVYYGAKEVLRVQK
jgi:hypothetical protein